MTFLSASTFSSFVALYATWAWLKAASQLVTPFLTMAKMLTVLRGLLELLEQLVAVLVLPQTGVLLSATPFAAR